MTSTRTSRECARTLHTFRFGHCSSCVAERSSVSRFDPLQLLSCTPSYQVAAVGMRIHLWITDCKCHLLCWHMCWHSKQSTLASFTSCAAAAPAVDVLQARCVHDCGPLHQPLEWPYWQGHDGVHLLPAQESRFDAPGHLCNCWRRSQLGSAVNFNRNPGL